jgi:hypothetical protein
MGLTTDRNDSCIYETDPDTGMQKCYLILPDGDRRELVRPIRTSYRHESCGTVTTMARELAETYAAQPTFYGATYCAWCQGHFPVGVNGEFVWVDDGTKVGS